MSQISQRNDARSLEQLKSAVEACLHPTQGWLKTAFRQYLGRDRSDLDAASHDFAQTLVQSEAITSLLLSYRVEQLSLPPERQGELLPTPERLGIPRDSLLYHPSRRALAPVTILTRLEEKTTAHALINSTDERYIAGRRLENENSNVAFYEGRFGYGVADTRGREMWTTVPSGQRVRCFSDVTYHAANPWACRSYGAATSIKFIREHGIDRCVGYTFLCDERKRVIAQHRLLFLPLSLMDIDADPTIEMHLQDGILKLRSDVFVWSVILEEPKTGDLSDNVFDLLPGIPYSLPWDEATCPMPKISRTGNNLLRRGP